VASRTTLNIFLVDVLRRLSVLLVVMYHIHLRFLINGYPVVLLSERKAG